jgi:hypothetical protein
MLGENVVFAVTDGSLVMAHQGAENWISFVVHHRDAGRARLGVGDQRLITADDDGTLGILSPIDVHSSAQEKRENYEAIYKSRAKLRGAVLADLVPEHPGLEAATCGYDRKVILCTPSGEGWQAVELCSDSGGLHHLAAGDLDGTPGEELVTCGYSGKVLVLRHPSPAGAAGH